MAVVLNDEQISRIYDEYDFHDDEEIVSAIWDRDFHRLMIDYKDRDDNFCTYKPIVDMDDPQDNAKINYILYGNVEDDMFWDDMETGIFDDDEEDF